MAKRTIALKLLPTSNQAQALTAVQAAFADACNAVVPFAVQHRCWNRVALHHQAYYPTRACTTGGAQLVCNAIAKVCQAYKALRLKKTEPVPTIGFSATGSVHLDKRTYTLFPGQVSLKTLEGRVIVPYQLGAHQQHLLEEGIPKEAELVYRCRPLSPIRLRQPGCVSSTSIQRIPRRRAVDVAVWGHDTNVGLCVPPVEAYSTATAMPLGISVRLPRSSARQRAL